MPENRYEETPPAFSEHRRRLLRLAVATPAILIAGRCGAVADKVGSENVSSVVSLSAERTLSLINTHTGESLVARYFAAGQYLADALSHLNALLRDHRSGEVSSIDPSLFDLLHTLAARADREPHYEVISGFRSKISNAQLRAHSSGVARHSLHMEGKAIDVRLSGVSCSRLRDFALAQERGGVGYYHKSDFVHLDTGRFRFWKG